MTGLAEDAPETDARWVIAIAGREEQIVVEAATVEDYSALGAASTIYHVAPGGSGDVALTVLRNAAGQVVFRAPTLSIAYLRRYGPPEHIILPPAARGPEGAPVVKHDAPSPLMTDAQLKAVTAAVASRLEQDARTAARSPARDPA